MTNAVGDIWECVAEFGLGSERGSMVFHREVTDVSDTSEIVMGDGIVTSLLTDAQATVADHMGTDAFLVCTTARRVPPAEITRTFVNYGTQALSILAKAVAAQSSVLLSMYPEPGGAIKNGRNYMPFLENIQQDAGQILAAGKAALEDSLNTWLLDVMTLTAGNLKAVLYRYATDIDPAVIVEIAESVLRPVLASQRRRVQHHQPFGA